MLEILYRRNVAVPVGIPAALSKPVSWSVSVVPIAASPLAVVSGTGVFSDSVTRSFVSLHRPSLERLFGSLPAVYETTHW